MEQGRQQQLRCYHMIRPTSGKVKIEDYDLEKDKMKIKEIINVSPQETAIASNLTVLENLKIYGWGIQNKQ